MKLSRTLFQTKNIRLRIHMYTTNETKGKVEPFYRKFDFNGSDYMTLDIKSYFTLECLNGEWSQDKSMYIDNKGLPHLKRCMKLMLKNLYEEADMFSVTEYNTPVISSESIKKYTIPIYNLGYNQRLVLQPVVVYDENEVAYEGVSILFNKTVNYSDLTIDEFESLVDIVSDLNLFTYSQQLANFYMIYCATVNGKEMQKITKSIEKINTNIFSKERESLLEKGVVEEKPFKEDPKDVFGLE